MSIAERTIRSRHLGNERRIWLQLPAKSAQMLLILLDGEYYVERIDAPTIVRALIERDVIPPTALVAVSHVDATTRWPESFCNPAFARFVDEELISWAVEACVAANDSKPRVILGGLSLTGLAAAHASLHSAKVDRVICQSASFWWEDCRLADEVPRRARPLHFYLSCGRRETTEVVDHGDGLIQRTSQLAGVRTMRDVLLRRGYTVSYEEFDGGHDIASWKSDLPLALKTICREIA